MSPLAILPVGLALGFAVWALINAVDALLERFGA